MITETKEVYKCEHCRKLYQIKKACIAHEPKCRKNPINKQRCYDGCKHLVKKEVTYFWDAYDGSHESKKEILFCNAKNEGVYPYWLNNPLYQEDIEGEIPNEVMPNECTKFEM
jgi:hypothetical protein